MLAGCYRFAAGGAPLTDLPEALTKPLPRYSSCRWPESGGSPPIRQPSAPKARR